MMDDLAPSAATLGAVEEVASQFGRKLDPAQAQTLGSYAELLLSWNAAINLTGARSVDSIVREHLPDAFALAGLAAGFARLVDVGSGGGLPGLPFAILERDFEVTLSEPRAKRRAFLSQALHRLGVRARVTEARAEELPAGAFGVAVARAVLPPDEWLRVGARLLEPDGRLIVLLSAESDWRPSTGAKVAEEVRYSAGPRSRLALALHVPRGT